MGWYLLFRMHVTWSFLDKGFCNLEHLVQNLLKHIWKLKKEKPFCLQNESMLDWLTPIIRHYLRRYDWEHLMKMAELLEFLGTNFKCNSFSSITSVWNFLAATALDTRSHTCTKYNFHCIVPLLWLCTTVYLCFRHAVMPIPSRVSDAHSKWTLVCGTMRQK